MKKYFLSGLLVVLPLFVTLVIVNFMVEFFTKPFYSLFTGILRLFGIHSDLSSFGSYFILLLLFAMTVLVGVFVRTYLTKCLVSYAERVIEKIPLINKIYRASRDVIHTFLRSQTPSFQKVVLVPYPTHSSYCLALLVKDSPKECSEALKTPLVSVFLPTTPNPTTGFIMMFDKDDVIETDLSIEDGLKFIISCGVIFPEKNGNAS